MVGYRIIHFLYNQFQLALKQNKELITLQLQLLINYLKLLIISIGKYT